MFSLDAAIINTKIISDAKYWQESTTLGFKERIIKYIFERYKKIISSGNYKNIEGNGIINNDNSNYIIPSIWLIIHNIGHAINRQKRCKLCWNKINY